MDVHLMTGRLFLRPWEATDAQAVYEACQDLEIQRWLPNLPSPYSLDDAACYVGELAPQAWTSGDGMPFGAFDAVTGALVGSLDIHRIDRRSGVGEIGYWAVAATRGRGLMSEAVGALSRWALQTQDDLARLELLHDVDNAPSCRVAHNAGFAAEAVLRDRLPDRDGTRRDAELHALLASDLR